jgi:riboflavin biosynthesis pyrimidine reductase
MITAVSGLALAEEATNAQELARSYLAWDGIRTNHVISSSGSFKDEFGSSRGLSTPEDLALLIELRKLADLVIVDAATARNEQYKQLSGTHLAIVSATGNFTSIPAVAAADKVTVFCEARPTTDFTDINHVKVSTSNPFKQLLQWATQMNMKSILVEAGPSLTQICFDTTQVAQSAITITPRVEWGSITGGINPFSQTGELISLAESSTASFTLWSY